MKDVPKSSPQKWLNRRKLYRVIVALGIISPFVLFITAYRSSLTPVEFTVDHRERVTSGSGENASSYYLVWTQEGEVYKVTDTWSFLRWDASDRYGKLKEGKRFRAKVAGWRVGFLSWYRNVIELEEIDSGSAPKPSE
jgi:hypothetical protein